MKGLGFLFKFSYRNLFRSPKRSLIMIVSLMLGSGFIIWDLNFANSGSREIMKEVLSQYAGFHHVTAPGYYEKDNKKVFNNYKLISEEDISDKSLFEKSSRRVTAPVFISGEKKTLGLLLTGIDVEKEKSLSSLYKAVTVGRHLSFHGSKEIIIGKRFAQRIDVQVGDEIAAVGQGLDGSIANELFKVVGLIDFGGGDLEESLAFTQIETAQELLSIPKNKFHQLVSFDSENDDYLPVVPGLETIKWTEILPEISVSIRFLDNFTWIIAFIIVIVISLGLSNTLMITFFEREQEFQSLNIIGAQAKLVTLSLIIEVFVMGTVAISLGVLLGHLATTFNYHYPINMKIFTGGQPILMGGMKIRPMVRVYPVLQYYWQVPILIYTFLFLTMIYPLLRVIRRSKNAI